jgi:hypothetical protein
MVKSYRLESNEYYDVVVKISEDGTEEELTESECVDELNEMLVKIDKLKKRKNNE